MKRYFVFLLMLITLFTTKTYAIEDPLARPNNKFGIHILFDIEIKDVPNLVNSNGGDWGYVLIPIQSGDKDLPKWQKFMDEAGKHHLIPIIRLATQGDYFNTKVWRKPKEADVLDFANFLNSLHWPTKNRYIIVYNEVNRGDEWGGAANAAEYANLLSYTATIFKSTNQDFFIISSGMDNAAPNQGSTYINEYTYMQQMNDAVPGIFNQVDGVSSHSYPNPGFSQPPTTHTRQSITSFEYERDLIKTFSSKKLPIFITETGWSSEAVSDTTIADYYKEALTTTWNDPDIVAITPFILKASGPFTKFTFLTTDNKETKQYSAYREFPKTKGKPSLTARVLSASSEISAPLPIKEFKKPIQKNAAIALSKSMQSAFGWLMKL